MAPPLAPPSPSGDTLQDRVRAVVRQYGPLAALALAAPAIVLARGPRGRQMVQDVRRAVGPQYLARLMESPHTYTMETLQPHDIRQLSQGRISGPMMHADVPTSYLQQVDLPFTRWLSRAAGPEGMPNVVSRVITTPLEELAGTTHETAHALGAERLRRRLRGKQDYPHEADIGELASFGFMTAGPLHADILGDPKTQAFVQSALAKWPALADYYAHYRQGRPPYVAYGELLNEAWAQARAAATGAPRAVHGADPSQWSEFYRSMVEKGRKGYGGEIESLTKTGRLPSGAPAIGQPAPMGEYESFRRFLQQRFPGVEPVKETLDFDPDVLDWLRHWTALMR